MKNWLQTPQLRDNLAKSFNIAASDVRTTPERVRASLIEAGVPQDAVLTSDQIMQLSTALQINRGTGGLSVKELLEAPSKLGDLCLNGIFAPFVADQDTLETQQRQLERAKYQQSMASAEMEQKEEIQRLQKIDEETKSSNPIKTKFEKGLKEGERKALDAKKQVTFQPPKTKEVEIDELLKHVDKPKPRKQVVEGESLFYSQSGSTVLRPALKQLYKGSVEQFCVYIYQVNKKQPLGYFDSHCKQAAGHLNYSEFLQLYMQDYAYPERNADSTKMPVPASTFKVDEFTVQQIWSKVNSTGGASIKLSQLIDYVTKAQTAKPNEETNANLLNQLKFRAKNNNPKFLNVLRDDFEEAVKSFGCRGKVPLTVFRQILASYMLVLTPADKKELKAKAILIKQSNLGFAQENEQEVLIYKTLIEEISPEEHVQAKNLFHQAASTFAFVIKIQRAWRRASIRIKKKRDQLRRQMEESERKRPQKGKKEKIVVPEKAVEEVKRKILTKEEKEKKKQQDLVVQRIEKRKGESLEKRLSLNIKSASKDPWVRERLRLQEEETKEYITTIVHELMLKAVCYGESLHKGLEIQHKFEVRPVKKFVFPLGQQFQITSTGVATKSLQYYNSLGQVMFLNSKNQLSQYDIAKTTSPLQVVNLGTRPPLKHYDIIDLVIDQKSGRLYTLNSNWILEIWNIEQQSDFPQKRIVICSTEEGKNYIGSTYKHTFNDAKPRFLCLQESNQQVLVVNTSCVDGSLVFIDPISFSVLKKMQLKYQEYEIPRNVRKSVQALQNMFEKIKKDDIDIFDSLADKATGQIEIESMFTQLLIKNPQQSRAHLKKICDHIDEDNSGTISREEFESMFGQDAIRESEEQHNLDDLTNQEEMWPEWIQNEQKQAQVQTMLALMQKTLETNLGINPVDAFSIYDLSDTGVCSEQEFKRAFQCFFGELLNSQKVELPLMLRLTEKNDANKINYQAFCKFLEKSFVQTFKHVEKTQDQKRNELEQVSETPLQQELNRSFSKEPTLTYVLQKAAELGIDLRKLFSQSDPLELSVIPRIKFWDILSGLPLGLSEDDLSKIFFADPKEGTGAAFVCMNYDNYGNVDYVNILNSDAFVELEKRRLTKKAVQMGKERNQAQQNEGKKADFSISDNRKVVIEDLVFIDDLEIIIYTTVKPRTSTIFITSFCKQTPNEEAKHEDEPLSKFQLIAKLKGHKNHDAPSICYVPQSNCLVSGEKHNTGNEMPQNISDLPRATDPESIPSHKVKSVRQTAYTQYTKRHLSAGYSNQCQILVWNLQQDMIAKFTSNPPWNVPFSRKFTAHDASIIDIVYMSKCQLLVTTSSDQTIKFWDPVSIAYDLTEPHEYPLNHTGGGNLIKIKAEKTKSNAAFKEVKRIYTGTDSVCYALRCLCINNIILPKPDQSMAVKGQIEWLICLKFTQTKGIQDDFQRKNRHSIISGYSIERVKLEVPAKHVDDIVPQYVVKECEDLVDLRRLKLIISHQKQMPVTVEKIMSQSQLQATYMDNVRTLFMQSILNRKDGKYVDPAPLREIYKLILKLPTRTKFQSFLSSSGCSNKLSVSETFFYLQKFMQIQPLRTTQIEFEKQIEEFYNRHQRQFLGGVKRWPNPVIQKLANYIRKNNLDLEFFKRDPRMLRAEGELEAENDFRENLSKLVTKCTTQRFAEYLQQINKGLSGGAAFKESEFKTIIIEMDPFNTGFVQLTQVRKFFNEEVAFYQEVDLEQERKILDTLRSIAIPSRKIALQKALLSANEVGDGYLTKVQFVEAIYKARIDIEKEKLEALFNKIAGNFEKSRKLFETDEVNGQPVLDKHLSLETLFTKLYHWNEQSEISCIDSTLACIKSALIYKGIDFRSIFVKSQDGDEYHESIEKVRFIELVTELGAIKTPKENIQKLANFLRLNQKESHRDLILMSSWLVNLRRVPTMLNISEKEDDIAICYKILKNETLFKSYCKVFKQKDGRVEVLDLVEIVRKFCRSSTSQWFAMFTDNTNTVSIDSMIEKMRSQVLEHGIPVNKLDVKESQPRTLLEMRGLDLLKTFQEMISRSKVTIDSYSVIKRCQQFDTNDTGSIPVFVLINILKHNNSGVFNQTFLALLKCDLEGLNFDGSVDYRDFVQSFIWEDVEKKQVISNLQKIDATTAQKFEEVLRKVCQCVKDNQVDIEKSFKVMSHGQRTISHAELLKVFKLIGCSLAESQFEILTLYTQSEEKHIDWKDLAIKIKYANVIKPIYNKDNWVQAVKTTHDSFELLAKIQENQQAIKQQLNQYKDEINCGLISAKTFQRSVQDAKLNFDVQQLEELTRYAVKGSQTADCNLQFDLDFDLVQCNFFWQALPAVVTELKFQINSIRQSKVVFVNEEDSFLVKDRKMRLQNEQKELKLSEQEVTIQAEMTKRITEIFLMREICFQDSFVEVYDPLRQKNEIEVKLFKELVQRLNLPLNFKDQRVLRRIADPHLKGKVDLNKFIPRFDTERLKSLRLNKVLEKVTVAFYIHNFELNKAFRTFDHENKKEISQLQFAQAIKSLQLGLTINEVNDLMQLAIKGPSDAIRYHEFITKLDLNIKHRKQQLQPKIEDEISQMLFPFFKDDCEEIKKTMGLFDFDNAIPTSVLVSDLPRIFKRLGLKSITNHLAFIMQQAKYEKDVVRIGIDDFLVNLKEAIGRRCTGDGWNRHETISGLNRLFGLLKTSGMSLFDFFLKLDSNFTFGISKIELKTGVQAMGMPLSDDEFNLIWNAMFKPNQSIAARRPQEDGTKSTLYEMMQPQDEEVSYLDLVTAFVEAGFLRIDDINDRAPMLIAKYRQVLKRLKLTPEQAYREYDPRSLGIVPRNDFLDILRLQTTDFNEDQMNKIFDEICKQPVNKNERMLSRFTQVQFFARIKERKQEDWLQQICIKINSKVLQQGLTFKKLFTKWAPVKLEKEKKAVGIKKKEESTEQKIKKQDLIRGLRELKAGLTNDEIQAFAEELKYEKSKQLEMLYAGAPRQAVLNVLLSNFEQLILTHVNQAFMEGESENTRLHNMYFASWIQKINDKCQLPQKIDMNFAEHDLDQEGQLNLVQFQALNQTLEVNLSKKQLKMAFDKMVLSDDIGKRLTLERLKHFMSLDYKKEEDKLKESNKIGRLQGSPVGEALESSEEKLNRLKTNEIYEEIKAYCERSSCTPETVFFQETEAELIRISKLTPGLTAEDDPILEVVKPQELITVNGIKKGLERLQIIINFPQAQKVIKDVCKMTHQDSVTYRDFIDFLLKRKTAIKYQEQGFINPMVASCMTQINQVRSAFNITIPKFFIYINGNMQFTKESDFEVEQKGNTVGHSSFVKCFIGMNLGLAVEDIVDLFNYIDTSMNGQITMKEFSEAMEHVNKRMGGQAQEESLIERGLLRPRKGVVNMRQINQILNIICESIQRHGYSILELYKSMDVNKTGYINRSVFAQQLHQISSMIKLDQVRVIENFFDDQSTGKICVIEFLLVCKEILNYNIGGGVFSEAQVTPIIQRIVQELCVEADEFMDRLCDLNFVWRESQEIKRVLALQQKPGQGQGASFNQFVQGICLCKSIFFNLLNEFGIVLREQEKAIITSVFGFGDKNSESLDFQLLDDSLETILQQFYNAESKDTAAWERRCFRRVGHHLMQNNISVFKFFRADDLTTLVTRTDCDQTLKSLFSNEKNLKLFLDKVFQEDAQLENGELLSKFWAAYTYEETFSDFDDHEIKLFITPKDAIRQQAPCEPKIQSSFQQSVMNLKFFKQVQSKFQEVSQVNSSALWQILDTKKAFIIRFKDFADSFTKHFGMGYERLLLRSLFQNIDKTGSGLILSAQVDTFCCLDITQMIANIETGFTTHQIIEILYKDLQNKKATMQEFYEQVQDNCCTLEEFHDSLDRLGFSYSEMQAFELLKVLNPTLNQVISYQEFIERAASKNINYVFSNRNKVTSTDVVQFNQRDKALELIIRTLENKLGNQTYKSYFGKYDLDSDKHLTPSELRMAILDLKEPQIKPTQIERMIHLLIDQVGQKYLIGLEEAKKLLSTYKCTELNDGSGNGQVLIDEDLFVYIVERYDGLSRMMEFVHNVEDRSTYLSRHTYEINMRGFNMASNQLIIKKLNKKSQVLNKLYEGTLVLIASEIMRLIKNEAQLCALDPTTNIDRIITDQQIGVLTSLSLPTIENAQIEIDYSSKEILPCGASKYSGMYMRTKETVEILQYPAEILQYVSLDGKTLKRHLATEIQMHRYLMGCKYEEDDELVNPEFAKREPFMDIFPNLGKFEKKINFQASTNDKELQREIYIVNKAIDSNWVNLEDFVTQNGGILNVPLFYHTDAPLYIIRHWAKLILDLIQKCHDVSVVLRSLSTKQLWISRDGKRIRLSHVRGIGRVNNLGYLSTAPDVYLNLDNNEEQQQHSVKKNDDQRRFSNQALDTPFIAPEVFFSKFQDHTDALDVWSFGMIMFCLLFGKQPVSYYKVYRQWQLDHHNHDVQNDNIPFTRSAASNFLYDPFAIDFETPFDNVNVNDLVEADANSKLQQIDDETGEEIRDGKFNFANFMKCIDNLSYSSMFSAKTSKKFDFQPIVGENESEEDMVPRFSGQRKEAGTVRKQIFKLLAKDSVLRRKNEMGLILDLLASCLDVDAKQRPTIGGLLNSHIFKLDSYETVSAVRFSQNVILYRSPVSNVTVALIHPLRQICAETMKTPFSIFDHRDVILKLFARVEDCISFVTGMPTEDMNEVMSNDEKRRASRKTNSVKFAKEQDSFGLQVSQNAPMAAQVVEEKVIDMLLFITFRYMKNFKMWKEKQIKEERLRGVEEWDPKTKGKPINMDSKGLPQGEVKWDGVQSKVEVKVNQAVKDKERQMHRMENQVLQCMIRLLKSMVHQMHSHATPLAPFASDVVNYVVKFFLGEESTFGSETVLMKTVSSDTKTLKDFLRERSFFRKESDLNAEFKSDIADKMWHLEQKNQVFLDKSNYWSHELHHHALQIYKDAIGECGVGADCYPVIRSYISSINQNMESKKIFSRQMNHLSVSYLIPMLRTQAYYSELIPIGDSIARLYDKNLEIKAKQGSLAMIRSVFQTGNSDKIKACLDMRVPKHLIQYLQDSNEHVRQECLYTFLEISKGLQDDDFEIIGKYASNLKQEFSKLGYTRTAFDLHKAVSMASQQEVLDADDKQKQVDAAKKRGRQSKQEPQISQEEQKSNEMKKTIALIEKNDNEKYINIALDLPNLYFLASKRFLKEMAVCFESPVFIAPLVRLLKTPTETNKNKEVILSIFKNLVCGNERVLIALNSPACDSYLTLLKILMVNSKMANAKASTSSSGLTTQMRAQIHLQDKTKSLFEYIFDQKRPTIIRDISTVSSHKSMLKDQDLMLPQIITLPDILDFFNKFLYKSELVPSDIDCEQIKKNLRNLRCWVKHFYAESLIPELTRIKALQRCMNILIKFLKAVWKDYFLCKGRIQEAQLLEQEISHKKMDRNEPEEKSNKLKQEYTEVIQLTLALFDWLCVSGKEFFIFNEECGRTNLTFVINLCNLVLSQFRWPLQKKTNSEKLYIEKKDLVNIIEKYDTKMPPLEDFTFNDLVNRTVQTQRRYDIFPFTNIGATLQNILYQLVRRNDPFLNGLLSQCNFGFVFGEQLLLDYEFIRHCIDNKMESLVLMDSYVKKNEIRLNTFEYLLRSTDGSLKDQLIKSNFCERIFIEYIKDFREFNIQFSKIDLEFLAFRRSFPLRLEALSMFNCALMLKQFAPQIYSEFLMHSRRHLLIRSELNFLKASDVVNSKETTVFLLFAIILESNESDLIYNMVQEGAPQRIRDLMKGQPSLSPRFPVLQQFINRF